MENVKSAVVAERLVVCRGCPSWVANRCEKNHFISSPRGCPDGKFPPLASVPSRRCTYCTSIASWTEVISTFWDAMKLWHNDGFSVVSDAVHDARFKVCKECARYDNYQCRECGCVAYLKTKLATEVCPLTPPKWT